MSLDEEIIRPLFAARLAKWRLASDGAVFETPSSWLAPVKQGAALAMLKIFKPTSDERNSVDFLRYLDGEAAVRVMAADQDALLMERAVGALSLAEIALSGGDMEAAEILATTIVKLHAPRRQSIPTILTPLEAQFASLFERAAALPSLTRCATLARSLLADQRDIVPLHGDLHHKNVLGGGERGWLVIDPKALIGDRAYETANLFGNPWPHAELVHDAERMLRLARFYAARLELDVKRVLAFALCHAGLSACWDMDDGLDPGYRLRCVELLEPLVG